MSQTAGKAEEIYKLTLRNSRKHRILLTVGFSLMAIFLVSGILMSRLGVEGRPLWDQQPLVQYLSVIFVFSLLMAIVVTSRVKFVSFEKKNFLKIFEAYKHLTRFISLSDSSSQEESDFDKVVKLLQKVSSKLSARRNKAEIMDVMREVNEKYFKLGKIIQTKILFYLQKRKELPLIQDKILKLADTFADTSLARLDSCITSIEALPETGDFKPSLPFLEANPQLRSAMVHIGRLSGSAILVTAVAVVLAIVFSIPLSEFAPYILTSTIVLFVGWEFKSK